MDLKKYSRLDYCQYLLSSQINYTITHLAEHLNSVSHDKINRYLKQEKLTPSLLWETVKTRLKSEPRGYIIFDDTVLDKNHSKQIELVRKQYSGNQKRVIKGIGLVNCLYVNSQTGEYWLIDYRIYDPEGDGKTKLDHVEDMLTNLVSHKQIPFKTVLIERLNN